MILKEEVQALQLEGKPVKAVSGNTKEDCTRLKGKKVQAIRSWGKHFLICFNDCTLRIHFLLFGSYRINSRKESEPRLQLHIGKHELNFYACSVKLLEQVADDIYDWERDIMSADWNEDKAVSRLKAAPAMLACDALLDQEIFSGSGNIIKNEVLFQCRIHPLSETGAIPARLLRKLARAVSAYSFDFLRWKKEGVLKKHWLAHTKKMCPRCHIPFEKAYTGKTNRRSFFCSNCQELYNKEQG